MMSSVRYVAGVASVGGDVVAANVGAVLVATDLINEADDKNVVEPGVHSSCKRKSYTITPCVELQCVAKHSKIFEMVFITEAVMLAWNRCYTSTTNWYY